MSLLLSSLLSYAQTLTEIPSPVGFSNSVRGFGEGVIEFQNNLYVRYFSNDNRHVLHKFDGTTLTEIPSPAGFDGAYGGYASSNESNGLVYPTIANGNLYMRYDQNDISAPSHLFSYDGNNLTQIPTPPQYLNAGDSGLGTHLRTLGSYVIGNYGIFYIRDLFKYDGDTLTMYPTPSTHLGPYNDGFFPPTVVGNVLFIRYAETNFNYDFLVHDKNS